MPDLQDGNSLPSYAAPGTHIFSNFQNNPIYHVQSSSEKNGDSSDSDTSISSVELTKFHEADRGHLELKSELQGRGDHSSRETDRGHPKLKSELQGRGDHSSLDESNINRHIGKDASSFRMLELGSSLGPLIPYGSTQEEEQSRQPESVGKAMWENRLQNNGHVHSSYVRARGMDEQVQSNNHAASLQNCLQSGGANIDCKDKEGVSDRVSNHTGRKNMDGASDRVSNLIGTYTSKPKAERELEQTPRLYGLQGSQQPSDSRCCPSVNVSRPQLAADEARAEWGKVSTKPSTSTYLRDGYQDSAQELADEEQERTRNQSSRIDVRVGDSEPFTLRGWAAAFLQPPPKEGDWEKENGSMRFLGKSSRGGCAWTVSEPSSASKESTGKEAIWCPVRPCLDGCQSSYLNNKNLKQGMKEPSGFGLVYP